MFHNNNSDDITIIDFTEDWIEEYLDLIESNDSEDPLYGQEISRDELRTRILTLWKSYPYAAKAELIAIKKKRLIGSARAVVIPRCGEQEQMVATLSLMVSPSYRGLGVGTKLLNCICKEMTSQNVGLIEIAIMDAWQDYQRFLKKHGFYSNKRFTDVVLNANESIKKQPPPVDVTIRSIELPNDRDKVIEIYNRERAQNYPNACAILPGQPAPWEKEPWSKYFDPETFLVAEDKRSKELVGYISSTIIPNRKPSGIIDYIDTTSKYKKTRLSERLLLQVVKTLRDKGAGDIRARVYFFGQGNEAELFQRIGFKIENSATVWQLSLSRI